MARWLRAGRVDQCPPGTAVEVVLESTVVAIYHVEDEWYALDGVCPHQGGPLGQGTLGQGTLAGNVVTCPWHGWQFDVTTGQHQLSRSIVQPRFPVRIEDDTIFIDMDATD